MAHEVSDWKQSNCSLSFKVDEVSDREPFSREINEAFGEGGGLNANYRTVEAVAKISNILGYHKFVYGVNFVFKTGGNTISFDFRNPDDLDIAQIALSSFLQKKDS